MARATATPAEETAVQAKTPEQIQAETDALLAMFGGEAEGPTLAEIERENRIDQVASIIGRAATFVKELLEGTPNPEAVLKTLQSLKTAKDRATAAIKAIPDDALTPEVGTVVYAVDDQALLTAEEGEL